MHILTRKLINLRLRKCHRTLTYISSSTLSEEDLRGGFLLHENFISETEENSIVSEIDPKLLRRRYNAGHWDGVIVKYREIGKSEWSPHNRETLKRFESFVFGDSSKYIPETHILDLHEEGHIKPHVDSIQFIGPLVSGVSLLSDAVMRFVLEEDASHHVTVLVPRLSLYIMSSRIRYKYTHEILSNPASVNGLVINRTRRITLMRRSCETEPREDVEKPQLILP